MTLTKIVDHGGEVESDPATAPAGGTSVRRFIGQLNTIVNGVRQRGFHTFFANFCAIRLVPLALVSRVRAGRIGGFALCQ